MSEYLSKYHVEELNEIATVILNAQKRVEVAASELQGDQEIIAKTNINQAILSLNHALQRLEWLKP